MNIAIIGSGNVAWHLAQALDKNGNKITEVFSRNITNAKKLCSKLYDAHPTDLLDFTTSKATIFIIAVPDDCIAEVSKKSHFPKQAILVHTAGSMTMSQLEASNCDNLGVFYPLQTFSKSKFIAFNTLPICIEASNLKTEKTLEKLAFSICENVCFYDASDRKKLHLAAVFACNFTNYMLIQAKKILENEDLSFEVLKPLIKETIDKALEIGPEKSQTGPAARNDTFTIQKHLDLLANKTELKAIYQLISNEIKKQNNS